MDIIISTSDPSEIDADEIVNAVVNLGYFVNTITVKER